MQSTNPDTRPLPNGWIQEYDQAYQTWYYVDLRCSPPTSTYQHPSDLYPSPRPHSESVSFPNVQDSFASVSQSNGNYYPHFPGGPEASSFSSCAPQSPHASMSPTGQQSFSPMPPVSSMAPGSQPQTQTPTAFFSMPEFPQSPTGQPPMSSAHPTSSMPYMSPFGQTPAQPGLPTYPTSVMSDMPTSAGKSTSPTYPASQVSGMIASSKPALVPETPIGHAAEYTTQSPVSQVPYSAPVIETGTHGSNERGFGKGVRKSFKKYGGLALEAAAAQSGSIAGAFVTNALLSSN